MNTANIVAKLKNLSPEQYVKLASLAFPEIQWTFYGSKEDWNGVDLVEKDNNSENRYCFQIDFDKDECRFYRGLSFIPLQFTETIAIVVYLMSLDLPFEKNENNNAKDVEQIGSLVQQNIRRGIVIHTPKVALDKLHSIFYYGQTIAGFSLDNGHSLVLENIGELDVIFNQTNERLYGEQAMQKAIELNLTDLDIEGMSEDDCFMAENWFALSKVDETGKTIRLYDSCFTRYNEAIDFLINMAEVHLT